MKIIKYKRNARAHLMSHAAVRPCFSCSFCDQSFTTKWNLKKHLKLNHGIDMEINDPLMNTGGSPLPPSMIDPGANKVPPPQNGNAFDKHRNSATAAAAVASKFFSPLPSSNLVAPPNLGSLAAMANFYNPNAATGGIVDSKDAAQQFYQNLTSKDLLNNQAEASKALQALTSVNMLMQSSLFAEHMLQFGNQFKQDLPAFDPSQHLNLPNLNNLAATMNQLTNRGAAANANAVNGVATSPLEEKVRGFKSDSDQTPTDAMEEEKPLNFADCPDRLQKNSDSL